MYYGSFYGKRKQRYKSFNETPFYPLRPFYLIDLRSILDLSNLARHFESLERPIESAICDLNVNGGQIKSISPNGKRDRGHYRRAH